MAAQLTTHLTHVKDIAVFECPESKEKYEEWIKVGANGELSEIIHCKLHQKFGVGLYLRFPYVSCRFPDIVYID